MNDFKYGHFMSYYFKILSLSILKHKTNCFKEEYILYRTKIAKKKLMSMEGIRPVKNLYNLKMLVVWI